MPAAASASGRDASLWYGSRAMASFADVERFFERIFERSSATLFRARIQAVQLERRVERAMERARIAPGRRGPSSRRATACG